MVGYIYKITCAANNKVYIGVTLRTVKSRWLEHQSRARYSNYRSAFHSAIRKYGVENFSVEVLESSNDNEYLYTIAEPYWIAMYNSISPNGYNLTSGGYITTMSEIIKQKISNSKLGHTVSLETRRKLADYNNKIWKVTLKNGTSFIVDNLTNWCKDNNINYKVLVTCKKYCKHSILKIEKV